MPSTYPLLELAPEDHSSEDFISFLRRNNPVVWEDKHWLVIENCKYHTPDKPWYTAFLKAGVPNVAPLIQKFGKMEWKKKPAHEQTIKRFHIHLF